MTRTNDLQKGFGFSVAIHLFFFAAFGFYTARTIQEPHTVKVSFVTLPEEVQQPVAPIAPPIPEKPMKSVAPVEKVKERKNEPKPEPRKVEAPAPLQKSEPITTESSTVSQEAVAQQPTETPVQAAPAVSSAETYIALNIAGIVKRIQANLVYPRMARKMGWTGKVVVTFLLTPNGTARDIEIVESSSSIFDQAVIDALQKTTDFPPPQTPTSITVPVTFSLQ